MSYSITTAVKKIRKIKKRKKVVQGSSSAGKTIAILIIIIDMCIKKAGLECSVISESIPHLKKGALKDFKKIMKGTGRWIDKNYNATDRIYTFTNGSYIEFFSPESVLGSRRNILYINEANHILYSDYHQLAIRTSDDIFIDFNPAAEFWAHTEVMNESNADFVQLTYLDNESRPSNVDEEFKIAIDKAEKEKAQGLPETSYWQNWVKVYVRGEIGNLVGVVFNNWEQVDEIPLGAKLLAIGMDFGFTNDPTAAEKVFEYNNDIYIDELIYEPGLTNSDIITKLKTLGIDSQMLIIADSAEPKSIEEIRRGGFKIEGADKGPDSIRSSIDTLQQRRIFVTKRSTNVIKELRSFRWKIDKSGKSLNEPVGTNDHSIAGIRYVALNKINKPSGQIILD